ncbi:hypothetical protein G6F21_014338 [Rhizopus arrhizus]|nr:hypothetical protein G6F21_014338 [Rhizopus arrhizus]
MPRSSSWMVPRVSALDRKGAGNAHALLHAARQLAGLLASGLRQAHHVQIAQAVFAHLFAVVGRPARPHAEFHVLQRGQPRQQRVRLEHHAPFQRRPGDLAAVHNDDALVGVVDAG